MTTTQPYDRAFNVAVVHITSRLFPTGFDVSDNAPNTFDALREHVSRTGRMCVWSGASDATIYADAEVNYASRAWHDWCHLAGNHEFTLEGEASAARMQIAHIRALYGDNETTRRWARLIWCEVVEQAMHVERTGEFVSDQMSFTRAYMGDA